MNEVFSRMQYEPCVLMFGSSYNLLNREVLDYNWNLVVTTNSDIQLAARLKNDARTIKDIFKISDMQANLLDRRNLHIIRLLGESELPKEISDFEIDDLEDEIAKKLEKISEIISRNGIILIEDFKNKIVSHKLLRKAFKGLFKNQKQIFLFNYTERDKYIDNLVEQGIVTTFEESINDFYEEYLSDVEVDYLASDGNSCYIYIESEKTGNVIPISKKELLETDNFATLLNISLFDETKVPQGMEQDYFSMFLKNSAREPQWFGYKYGFNLQRSYEKRLYRMVKRGLENVGKEKNKPLILAGQTGTGKSIALAFLAYKIFNEKKYPVVYINDSDVNFNTNIEYKHKEIMKKDSPAFNALDNLLKYLEDNGAKAVLLIWDTASYSTGREKSFRLYRALLSRGRKVFMVSTSYEFSTSTDFVANNSSEEGIEEDVINRKFVECRAEIKLSDEVEQLRNILEEKCGFPLEKIEKITSLYFNNNNFLSLFYQVFEGIRGELSKGVFREASLNMNELEKFLSTDFQIEERDNVFALALKRLENDLIEAGIVDSVESVEEIENYRIEVSKDEFIKSIALCSKFKLKMPYDFALRILGTYNTCVNKFYFFYDYTRLLWKL